MFEKGTVGSFWVKYWKSYRVLIKVSVTTEMFFVAISTTSVKQETVKSFNPKGVFSRRYMPFYRFIWFKNLNGRGHLEHVLVKEKTILKLILKIQSERLLTGFIWFRTESSCRLL
jgi:hypothetical protein